MEPFQVCHNNVAFGETGPSAGFLEGLVDGMRCGILAVDRDARVVLVNDVGWQILGLPERPVPGSPIRTALSRHGQLVQLLTESFRMASLPNRAELDLDRDTPRAKTIGFTLSMISNAESEAIGAAMFFKDLTQIEHREERQRLKERLAAVGTMAASLAHEIRNPLASIEVSCGLLRRRVRELPQAEKLIDKITAEIRRLNDTITSSLDFVRPVATSLGIAELRPVLEESLDVASRCASAESIEIELRVAEDLPPFLMDRSQLRRLFENLLINAIEAIGERGRVVVEADAIPAPSSSSIPYEPATPASRDPFRTFEQCAVIRVSDSGPGISEEDRDRIFFPFFTTKQQGSGVGLPTVKKIVDSHRGLIDVDQGPEGGARFTVRLPMVLRTAEVASR